MKISEWKNIIQQSTLKSLLQLFFSLFFAGKTAKPGLFAILSLFRNELVI